MGYYVTGFKDRGYFIHDSKRIETIWMSNVQIRKINPKFRNMSIRTSAFKGQILKKIASNSAITAMLDVEEAGKGAKRALVYFDYTNELFGSVKAGESEVLWESFDRLPYYDKECEYTNLFSDKTGKVRNEFYALIGSPIRDLFFKSYMEDAVERQENDSIEEVKPIEVVVEVPSVESNVEEAVTVEESEPAVKKNPVHEAVNQLIHGGMFDTLNIKSPAVEDMYKLILLSQGDDTVLTVPQDIMKGMRYRIHAILDKTFDMSKMTTLGTLKFEGIELILVVTADETSKLNKVQIIRSSRPENGKVYDMEYIKENYYKWRLKNQYVR